VLVRSAHGGPVDFISLSSLREFCLALLKRAIIVTCWAAL
jgi:hypothetical protein